MKSYKYSLGLVGYPLEHSLSPLLHGAALRALELEGTYRLYPIQPFPAGAQALTDLLEQLRRGELQGLNVTIPHKQAVMSYLDDLTPVARAIGAVNTIFSQDDGCLVGDNTDSPGFLADLKRVTHSVFHADTGHAPTSLFNALVLGAGGSARAVVYALAQVGWQVTIAARRLKQAEQLIDSFQQFVFSDQLQAIPMSRLSTSLQANMVDTHVLNPISHISLIINTTPVGMWPNVDESPWPEDTPFPKGGVVYDLVYNPAETTLVRSAQSAGLIAVTGLGMLVEQAALAFERWTGCSPSREAMRQAVPSVFSPASR